MSPSAPDAAMAHRLEPDFFERLFEGAGLAVFACDLRGRVLAWNSHGEQLCRRDIALEPGVMLRELLPEADRATFDEQLAALIETHEPLEFRTRFVSRDGEPCEYAVWLAPLQADGDALQGVSVWFHDITARINVRKSLRKSERLSSLGAMSGSVAHHYSNLLCGIATSLEYALNMNTMPAMRRALQRTAEAVARGSQLTQQLLAFAQADYRLCDMADLTEMVLYYFDENEQRLAERGVRVALEWEPVPRLSLPRDQFMVVLANLTLNACEAMPEGGKLTVRLAPADAEHIRLAISDSGPGIRPEHMDRLFEPFFTTKGELGAGAARAAGMGLAVAHGLVSEMHGAITASNTPEGGARFDIVLPLTPPSRESLSADDRAGCDVATQANSAANHS